VRGPKSLSVAGATCDGVLLAEPASPAYLARARSQAEASAAKAGRPQPQVALYARFCVDGDPGRARERLIPILEEDVRGHETRVQLTGLPFSDELAERIENRPGGGFLEPRWVDQLAVAGTPGECAAALRALTDAGADRVILLPRAGEEQAQIEQFARDVRPLLS
jgi:alkanesulfonate monooxygenase SsuD/methylene tetrahydromethanopterin reductase-like flavin-dependent oxidoreductase (luciferase family)